MEASTSKRKGDHEINDGRTEKRRRDESSNGPPRSKVPRERDPEDGPHSGSGRPQSKETKGLKAEQFTNSRHHPSLSRKVGDRVQMEASTSPRSGGKSPRGSPGQRSVESKGPSMMAREGEASLARLMNSRLSWSQRDTTTGMTRSAFREVYKGKSSPVRDAELLSPSSLPLRPRLFNDHLFNKDVLRQKSKPFAGLSEIDVNDSGGSHTRHNPTQPIIQPLQESQSRYRGLSHLVASGARPQTAMYVGTYLSPRQGLFDTWNDVSLNAKRAEERVKYLEKSILPFGRYLHHNNNNNINITNNFSPYVAIPSLMMTATPPLQPPSLGMLSAPSENWCARCKTSFRMTSDLVYHMRTYHRRDNTPTTALSNGDGDGITHGNKKKEGEGQNGGRSCEEKSLRCHVCRETFRERHHLTRHMTSHIR